MTAQIGAAFVTAALLSLASPAFAARPMTIQDLLGAVRVSDPQLSPDGRQVVFVRTTTDVAAGKRNADLWIVPADGSAAPRLLVGGDKSENTPRWDLDGSHVAFVITNQLDFRVPVDQGLQLFTALRLRGVPAEALVFEDEAHWVLKAPNSKIWHEKVFGWMNRYLGT